MDCPKVFVAGAAVWPNKPVVVDPKAGLFAPKPPSVLVLVCPKPKLVVVAVAPNGFPNVLPWVDPKAGAVDCPNVLVVLPNRPVLGWDVVVWPNRD